MADEHCLLDQRILNLNKNAAGATCGEGLKDKRSIFEQQARFEETLR